MSRFHSISIHHPSGECPPIVNDVVCSDRPLISHLHVAPQMDKESRTRSSRGVSSLSLRLFALGLRANNRRLLEPCCLGGSQLMNLRYLHSADSCSRRLSLVFLLPDFLCYVLHPLICSSLEGGLISFFFAVGATCCFYFPMLLSRVSLLAAYGCST